MTVTEDGVRLELRTAAVGDEAEPVVAAEPAPAESAPAEPAPAEPARPSDPRRRPRATPSPSSWPRGRRSA